MASPSRGGARANSGPKKKSQMTEDEKRERSIRQKARIAAAESGKLPHEILLDIARGECIKQKRLVITIHKTGPDKGKEKSREWIEEDYYPNFTERMDATKAAAPYYAPRLATQMIKTDAKTTDALTEVMKQLAGKLPG